MIKKSILIFLPAADFNEEEFAAVYRQVKNAGHQVFIASDAVYFCTGKNGLKVKNDINILNIHEKNFNAFVLIGGNGVKKYWNNKLLHKVILQFNSADKLIAAICAAPVALARAGILKNKTAACYPDVKNELLLNGAVYSNNEICFSSNILTAAAPANAQEFAKHLINELKD